MKNTACDKKLICRKEFDNYPCDYIWYSAIDGKCTRRNKNGRCTNSDAWPENQTSKMQAVGLGLKENQ